MPVVSDPVVQSYIAYSSILAVKVLLMSPLTGRLRFSKGVFANTEDTPLQQGSVVKLDDPDVERVRRAHRNDLENIPAFWVLGAFYVTTGPAAPLAINLFRAYTAGRIIHTLVYAVKPLPQPTRAIAYAVPTIIMWYMGYKVISYYFEAL